MKKHSIFGSALLSTALFLGACGDNEEVTDTTVDKEMTDTVDTVDSGQAQNEFGFQAFDLDIDTAEHNDAIDASFDIDVSETEAEYENKLESKNLTGNEAYAELEPIFKDLALTKDMSKEDVITKVSKAFGAENYTEFELEVEFSDGDNQEFSDKK